MRSVFVCCLYSSRAAANVERKLSVLDVGIVWAGHSDKAVKNEEEHRPSLRRTCVNRIRTRGVTASGLHGCRLYKGTYLDRL